MPILGFMDNDPYGLDIFAVYKWGSRASLSPKFCPSNNYIHLLGTIIRTDFTLPFPEMHFPA